MKKMMFVFSVMLIVAGALSFVSIETTTASDQVRVTVENAQTFDAMIAPKVLLAQSCVPKGGDCTYYRCCAGTYCRKIGGKDGDKVCQ